jgi:hypothetical protein
VLGFVVVIVGIGLLLRKRVGDTDERRGVV